MLADVYLRQIWKKCACQCDCHCQQFSAASIVRSSKTNSTVCELFWVTTFLLSFWYVIVLSFKHQIWILYHPHFTWQKSQRQLFENLGSLNRREECYFLWFGWVDCFLSGDATVTIAHRCTPKDQLKELTSLADIIIAAAGNFTPDTIKTHACLSVLLQFNHWFPK